MAFSSIKEFLSGSVINKGLIDDSRFKVIFLDNKFNSEKFNNSFLTNLSYSVNSVSLPAHGIQYSNNRLFTKLGGRQYGSLSITFFENKDQDVKNYFYEWMDFISPWNSQHKYGAVRQYVEDFTTTIEISNLDYRNEDSSDKILYTNKFVNAFPSNISERNFDISKDDIGFITISFDYEYHEGKFSTNKN